MKSFGQSQEQRPKVVKVSFWQMPSTGKWSYVFQGASVQVENTVADLFTAEGFDDFTHAAADAVETLARFEKGVVIV